MPNPFCHIELQTDDTDKAKDFYGQLFDWKFDDMPMPEGIYSMINVGEGTGGGIVKTPVPNVPSHWLSYVLVDDVAASLEKAQSLGGTVLQDKMDIANYGSLGVIQDPTGAVFALWQQMAE